MSEYWKSTPKYWCKHCKTFVRDTKLETSNHNASPKHQGNLKRFLRDLQRNSEKEEKEKERARSEVARLNGLVSNVKSRTQLNSTTGVRASYYRSNTAASSPLIATESQRKQNLVQLAEMGISIPTELRPDMAMPGEWQVISERIICHTEDEKKPNISVNCKPNGMLDEDENEEQEEYPKIKKRKTKIPPRILSHQENEKDLETLLKTVVPNKKQEIKSEFGEDSAKEKKEIDKSLQTCQDESCNNLVQIKSEPCESSSISLLSYDDKNQEQSQLLNVIFKKRKVKNIRQKNS